VDEVIAGKMTRRPTPIFNAGSELLDGRFEIRQLIGTGGTGVVYKALDRTQGIDVALKTLFWVDPSSIYRLKREFRVLADVVHPNLIGLQELFVEDNLCFFTMDFVQGTPILEVVREDGATWADSLSQSAPSIVLAGNGEVIASDQSSELDAGRAIANPCAVIEVSDDRLNNALVHSGVVEWPAGTSGNSLLNETALRFYLPQLINGVVALHRAGILHRDLKPLNILINEKGELIILDFGISRDLLRGDSFIGVDEGICGTPAYMAPEQAAGKQAEPASDWYAVGAILYEALTGRLPFYGTSRQIMDAKQAKDPVDPRQYVPDAPDDLCALCIELLARDPALRPTGAEILSRVGARDYTSLGPTRVRISRDQELVGRQQQLKALRQALSGVQAGKTVLVLLSGKAGMGKTALLNRFLEEVRRDTRAVVLTGRCYESESIPYKALDNAIDELRAHLTGFRSSEIARIWPEGVGALGLLFPVLASFENSQSRARLKELAIDSLQLRNAAYRSLKELLGRIAPKVPLVLAIDDLQWGDLDSAALVRELLSTPGNPPLLLIASYRDESGLRPPFIDYITRRDDYAGLTLDTIQLLIEGLDREDALRFAEELLGGHTEVCRAQAEIICRESDRSPLLIQELAGYVASTRHANPENVLGAARWSFSEVIQSRLQQVSPATRRLFELVCVAGRPVNQLVLGDAERGDGNLQRTLRALQAKRLISLHRTRSVTNVDVYHNRIRDAILLSMSDADLRSCHLLLAESYQRSGDSDPYLLANHYYGGGEFEKAGNFAEIAADLAAGSFAFERAAQMYRMALELGSKSAAGVRALQARLAEVLSNAGRGSDAAPLFFQAAEGAPFTEALSLRRRAAEQWLVSGNNRQGMDALKLVTKAVGLSLPATPRSALLNLLFTRAKLRLFGIRFRERAEQDILPLELLRVDVCNVSTALSFGNTILGAHFQARHLWLALRVGDPFRVAIGLCREAIFNSIEGTTKEKRARALQTKAKTLTQGLDSSLIQGYHYLVEGHSNYMFGRWTVCSDALQMAEKILTERCSGVTWELNSLRFFWGNSLVFQGRWRELGERLGRWLDDAQARSDIYAFSSLQILGTRCLTLSSGEVERARQEIDLGMRLWSSKEFGVQRFLADISKIQLDIYEGSINAALEKLEAMWPEFFHSMMRRIQLCRIHVFYHAGFVQLAVASRQEGDPKRKALRKAATYARALERETAQWAAPYAAYIRACIQYLEGNNPAAIARLETAIVGFEKAGMRLYRAAAQRRLGQLIRDQRGTELVGDAERVFTEQGVRDPPRLASMMAPGFSETDPI
jgi:eukaryotic-like serine/threonine-protein kinase